MLNDEEIRTMEKEIEAEVDGGKLAQSATIEWGGDQGGSMDEPGTEPEQPPQPMQPEEVLLGEYSPETTNGNGSKKNIPDLEHINTLEQILEEVGE